MAVYEFSSFYNENLVAGIKVAENAGWINTFHFSEANRDFRFNPKPYYYSGNSPQVVHHKMNANRDFHREHYRVARNRRIFLKVPTDPWENDKRQRNFAIAKFRPNDDDILIFSDIDEIIDSRRYLELLDTVKSKGIITIKLHYTLYFFNLFSKNWVGPPDYSYRLFMMTGNYFNAMKINSDELRKSGERGDLMDSVYCFPDHAGYHHSWLGSHDEAIKKLNSYPHASFEHDPDLYTAEGLIMKDSVANFISSGKSVYGPDHELEIRDDIPQLSVVDLRRNTDLGAYFL